MDIWNNDYEGIPSDISVSDNGDDGIRSIKANTSIRLELEHNFKDESTPYHKEGLCSVLFSGTTAEINTLTGVPVGGVAYDTEVEVLKVYNGTSWIIQVVSHSQLSGLTADDHSEYLNLTKVSQEIEENIGIKTLGTLGGIDPSIDSARIDSLFIKTILALDLIFDAAGKEIRREDTGSFIDDGFIVGDVIHTYSTNNAGPFTIETVTDTIMIVVETVVDESSIDISIYTLRKGFTDMYSTSFNNNSTYGPELLDCIVWAVAPSYGSVAYIKGFSGNNSANTLRVASYRTSNTGMHPFGVSAFPVRRGQYWRVMFAYTHIDLLASGLTIFRMRLDI